MIQLIRDLIFSYKFKKAKKKAIRLQQENRRKYLVIRLNKKLKVVTKQNLKVLIDRRRFKKGVKIQDIEKKALFITK